MMATIVGGGFGLYGYLPALMTSDVSVMLPQRYQPHILQRPDIAPYFPRIQWGCDADILQQCDAVIMALPPQQQAATIERYLKYSNCNYYLLEKPLAATPTESKHLLEMMTSSQKKFRIGYNFRFTDWGKSLLQQHQGVNEIVWEFHAHHYAQNIPTWKRTHSAGGGALRFYGIHLIAILAEMGYTTVLSSDAAHSHKEELASWTAVFRGDGYPDCRISVNTRSSHSSFMIKHHDSVQTFDHPFQAYPSAKNSTDVRIPYLISMLRELFNDNNQAHDWYGRVNELWQSTEART